MTPKSSRPLAERFWSKVAKAEGCWLWTAGCNEHGYGILAVNGRPERAHRIAWMLTHGPIPSGAWVLHRCDIPACVNPAHLYLGTPMDNTHDAMARGRLKPPPRARFLGSAHPNSRLSEDHVREIRARFSGRGSRAALAREYGVTYGTVCDIISRRTWAHI